MSETRQQTTTYRELVKPKCSACGVEMWLLRIEAHIASDHMTFECSRCHAQIEQEFAPGSSVPKL